MFIKLSRAVLAGLAISAMAIGGTGIAAAQTPSDTPSPTSSPSAQPSGSPSASPSSSPTASPSESPSATPSSPSTSPSASPQQRAPQANAVSISKENQARYDGLSAELKSTLGAVKGDTVRENGLVIDRFTNGALVWSSGDGSKVIQGHIYNQWNRDAGARKALGAPTTDEVAGDDNSRVSYFTNGIINWSASTGTNAVYGAIYGHYKANRSALGLPTSSEFTGQRGARVTRFQKGLVIWTAKTGPRIVSGKMLEHYGALGWEGGILNVPSSDEFTGQRNLRVQRFAGGLMVNTPGVGPREVHGRILDRYAAYGWEGGVLGAPTSDEFTGGRGAKVNTFEGGVIVYTPSTDAHAVYGANFDRYGAHGWEGGVLGVPTTDEFNGANGARSQRFANGLIIFKPGIGSYAVHGAILWQYSQMGFEGGALGAPTSDEYAINGGVAQNFERGTVRYNFSTGALTVQTQANLPAECITRGRVLCISKNDRKLRYVVNGKVELSLDVRFGSELTPTRNGTFSVYWKHRDHVSSIYGTRMPFSMFFSGGQAVHYSDDFARRGWNGSSAGCVNVRDWDQLEWLYGQVREGDRVIVYN